MGRELKCTKCDGELKDMNKSITAIDPKNNYGMITASLHKCLDCGHKLYVETGKFKEE